METRANYIAVGFFTILVILASFGFIYWVAQIDNQAAQRRITIGVRGVVSGLSRNSEVHFNGIRVGRVIRVRFNEDDPAEVLAVADINEETPLRVDTTATIAAQGLTGLSIVSLKGGGKDSPSLYDVTEEGMYPRIDARPSAVTDILETARDVAGKANNALASLEKFIEENRQPVSSAVANIERFSQSLSNNADGVDEFLKSASGIGTSLAQLSDKLDGTIKQVEKITAAVDPEKIKMTVENVSEFSQNMKKGSQRVETVMASAEKIAKELEGFSGRLDKTFNNVDGLVKSVKAEDVKQAISDIKLAASNAKSVTQTIAGRKGDINKIISNVEQMSSELKKSSSRIDGVLAKLDGFFGSEGGEDIIGDVRKTLADFRSVAKTLQTSINNVSGGLTRFTKSGLSDIEGLVSDARRSMRRIDRVVSQIERNPQQFIFGNSNGGVRTYQGRPRR